MKKIITTKHTFNNSVLNVKYEVLNNFVSCAKVKAINIYEYDPESGDYGIAYEFSSNANNLEEKIDLDWHGEILCIFEDNTCNHLIKAVYKLQVVDSKKCNPPCCIDKDGDDWVVTEYYVDMSEYERKMLESVNLQCDNCDVPLTTVNGLLKLFAVKAAAESDSPMLETIFAKLDCNCNNYVIPMAHTKNCNCNG